MNNRNDEQCHFKVSFDVYGVVGECAENKEPKDALCFLSFSEFCPASQIKASLPVLIHIF